MDLLGIVKNCALACVLGLATLAAMPDAAAEKLIRHAPHGDTSIVDTAAKTIPPASPTETFTRNGITFNIYYMDVINATNYGFDGATTGTPARARLRETFEYVAEVVNMNGTLNVVVANSSSANSGFLAAAGTYYSTAPGFNKPLSLRSLENGSPVAPGTEEIFIQVRFGNINWNLTTDPPAFTEYDFVSVMLHEITHGLGFAGLMNSSGAGLGSGSAYSTFTQFIYGSVTNGRVVTNPGPAYTGTAAELANNPSLLSFDGPLTIASYGSRPGIYAPSPFASGSSFSHWNTGNVTGNPVMEHAIFNGEMHREYETYEVETLEDIGWVNAAPLGILASLSSATYSVNEAEGSIQIDVNLSEAPGATTVQVDYSTGEAGDTAANGADYDDTSGTLSFTGAQVTQSFTININDNFVWDGDRFLTIRLSNAQDGSLGNPIAATLTIVDNELDPDGVYITGPYFVEENQDITLTVNTNIPQLDLDSPSVVLQWEKDTADLTGEDARTLQLFGVTPANDGVYRCQVSDPAIYASTISQPYVLTVLPEGSVPVGGAAALGLLAGLCAGTGAAGIRRKNRSGR